MKTAKEVKQIAQEFIDGQICNFDDICNIILRVAGEGRFHIKCQVEIDETVIEKLQNLGYTVRRGERGRSTNGWMCNISWNEA